MTKKILLAIITFLIFTVSQSAVVSAGTFYRQEVIGKTIATEPLAKSAGASMRNAAGNIVVVGWGSDKLGSASSHMYIWEISPTDELLATHKFESAVFAKSQGGISGSSISAYANTIVQQSDGKYVLAGHVTGSSDPDLIVWRFNPDWTLDTTFNGQGFLVFDKSPNGTEGFYAARKITVAADGSYAVAGQLQNLRINGSITHRSFIIKVTTAGALDSTFINSGYLEFSEIAGQSYTIFLGDVVNSDEGLLVLLNANIGRGPVHPILLRLDASGNLDTSFGQNGYQEIYSPLGKETSLSGDTLVYEDQAIYLFASQNQTLYMWRMDHSGNMDAEFADQGYAAFVTKDGGNYVAAGAMEVNDKIVAWGGSRKGSSLRSDLVIWHIDKNGSLDSTVTPADYLETINANTIYNEDKTELFLLEDGRYIAFVQATDNTVFRFQTIHYQELHGILGLGENQDALVDGKSVKGTEGYVYGLKEVTLTHDGKRIAEFKQDLSTDVILSPSFQFADNAGSFSLGQDRVVYDFYLPYREDVTHIAICPGMSSDQAEKDCEGVEKIKLDKNVEEDYMVAKDVSSTEFSFILYKQSTNILLITGITIGLTVLGGLFLLFGKKKSTTRAEMKAKVQGPAAL